MAYEQEDSTQRVSQGYSPGRQIYYHFGSAYGIPRPDSAWAKRGGTLIYIGTEQQIKEALVTGKRSKYGWKNEILDAERQATAPKDGENDGHGN